MHRTTVMLPPELKARAEAQARRKGMSLGELIRQALDREVMYEIQDSAVEDPLFADRVVFDGSTPADLAAHHDAYLYDDAAGAQGSGP